MTRLSPTGMSSAAAFIDSIDHRHEASRSIVLRYRNAIRMEPDDAQDAQLKELFGRTSIREGLRVVPFLAYRGVEIDILDETSLTHTRTLKSIDGCISVAHCLLRGYRRVVFESGGNTGMALTVYGTGAGLETFLFVPTENLRLLDSKVFQDEGAHVIAVDDPRQVKPAAAAFAARHDLPRIPALDWRIQASTLVGCFLLEHLLSARPYDVLAQSISAAFGPVGIYRVLESHRERVGRLPGFLGVQQATNCPMVRAWKTGTRTGPARPVESTTRLLARVMYDDEPGTYGTWEPLRRILTVTGGDLTSVDHEDFVRGLATVVEGRSVLDHLSERGIPVTLEDGEVLEKAGLMALTGALREIDAERIPDGSRVLVCITGGTARPDGQVRAHRWGTSDLEEINEAAARPAGAATARSS